MPTLNINNNTDLEGVLGNGNTTGGQLITGNNAQNFALINDNIALIGHDDGAGTSSNVVTQQTHAQIDFANATATGYSKIDETKNDIQHDVAIHLTAPNVNLPNETASLILSTDGIKNVKGLATTTYPSLTELSYVKGVTSEIQTQINNLVGGNVSFPRISGDWYSSAVTDFVSSTAALTKDVIRLTPFIVSETTSFDKIAMEISGAGTAGSVVRLGIYNSTNNYPSTNLLNAGTILGDSATNQTITISQSLTPGVYWLAYTHNSTANISFRTIQATTGAIPAVLGLKDGDFTGNQLNLVTMSYVYDGTFPTISGSSVTGLNLAIVALRKA